MTIKGRYSTHSTIEGVDALTSDNVFVDTVASSEPATHTDRYSYINTTDNKLYIADGTSFSEVVDLVVGRDYIAQDTGLCYLFDGTHLRATGGDYTAGVGISITNREVSFKGDNTTVCADASGVIYSPSEFPSTPSENGTYTLKVTVTDGVAVKSWVLDV
jgi:hypothetical protein